MRRHLARVLVGFALAATPALATANTCDQRMQEIRGELNELSYDLSQRQQTIAWRGSMFDQNVMLFRQIQGGLAQQNAYFLQVRGAHQRIRFDLARLEDELDYLYGYPPSQQVNSRIQYLQMAQSDLMLREQTIGFDLEQVTADLRRGMEQAGEMKAQLDADHKELMAAIATAGEKHSRFEGLRGELNFLGTQDGRANCAADQLDALKKEVETQSAGLSALEIIQAQARKTAADAEALNADLQKTLDEIGEI